MNDVHSNTPAQKIPVSNYLNTLQHFCCRGMDGHSPTKKLFIQRDYSQGIAVKFATEFPHELRGKVRSNAKCGEGQKTIN